MSTYDHFDTLAIQAGLDYADETGAVVPPIYATSTFRWGNKGGFDYTRSGNPNFRNLQTTLAALEHAPHAVSFGNGVAAITAVVSSLKQGDLIVAEENIYGCTFRLFHQVFEKFGLQVVYLDLSDPVNHARAAALKPELVWLESPTNPLLKVVDIQAVADAVHAVGATVLVDNTFCSPAVQQPLSLGADLSLSSTTKYINGHSDCLGGVVCTHDQTWYDKLIFAQKALGLNPSPFDAWLIARGVKTLGLRMQRHADNALALAQHLEAHPQIKQVRYPFLDSHPQVAVARRQMTNGGGMLTVDLGLDLDDTRAFLEGLQLFAYAESLGGVESLVCHPAGMTHAAVPKDVREKVGVTDGLVRFSVGIEHINDLIADIEHALEGVGHAHTRLA